MLHLNQMAERIGIDKMAFCGDKADCTFFDEYNFEGLMDVPWYDRVKGDEMRRLFDDANLHEFDQLKNQAPLKRQKRKRVNSLAQPISSQEDEVEIDQANLMTAHKL